MSTPFTESSIQDIDEVMQRSSLAFEQFRLVPAMQKAAFLDKIADEIEALGDLLINQASTETNLPAPRLVGERARTILQLRLNAQMVREGSWVEATIDTAIPDKNPPKPDLRRMLIPLGPVVVFGASNFPFAYSTAGGDTASALAAGCPVVVKAHPAHAATSELVAAAAIRAAHATGMPEFVFQHVHGSSFESGKALVQHPLTAAVGFTGSLTGGKALYDYAAARTNPIPVFSEMGSINPVLLLPDLLVTQPEAVAVQYAASITQGMGQFCTNPGLLLAVEGPGLLQFKKTLSEEIEKVMPAKMLHTGIHAAYFKKKGEALQQDGVELVSQSAHTAGNLEALPTIATVEGTVFRANHLLQEEVFGPYSLLVVNKDVTELIETWKMVKGQLTTSLMGTDKDFENHTTLVHIATQIAGRVVFNGVPTGVEVCPAMVHGGPYPATTDSRFTAVGIHAVKRWIRPICFQNAPISLLPAELHPDNPAQVWRLLNNEWTKNKG